MTLVNGTEYRACRGRERKGGGGKIDKRRRVRPIQEAVVSLQQSRSPTATPTAEMLNNQSPGLSIKNATKRKRPSNEAVKEGHEYEAHSTAAAAVLPQHQQSREENSGKEQNHCTSTRIAGIISTLLGKDPPSRGAILEEGGKHSTTTATARTKQNWPPSI
eukprot:TRINITY_DN32500_c0_g1_i1.p1 TRINITY_DN32500_c0_g1~~TRINITY_DN32500_c0_g1_i1.p1  ORF type:complete len:161 (+),score=19.89 TRINITY_DN32500_c0_g1_i1:647-1129(+)